MKITNGELYRQIKQFRDDGLSYGKIAARLLPEKSKESKSAARAIIYKFFMNHTTITDNAVRKELNLEMVFEVPESQIKKPSKGNRARSLRPETIEVNKNSAKSAARSLKKCYFEIEELVKELLK